MRTPPADGRTMMLMLLFGAAAVFTCLGVWVGTVICVLVVLLLA